MARRFKAAIFNDDRTMSVHYISKKLKIGHSAFRVSKKSDEVYLIDPDYTVTTTTKRLGVPFRYTTCYYKRNIPKPLPSHKMSGGEALGTIEFTETKKGNKEESGIVITKPLHAPAFNDWKYEGITSKELGILFNPQFYSMVAKANKNKREELSFLIQCGTAAGVAFIIYNLLQQLPGNIDRIIHAALTGTPGR